MPRRTSYALNHLDLNLSAKYRFSNELMPSGRWRSGSRSRLERGCRAGLTLCVSALSSKVAFGLRDLA